MLTGEENFRPHQQLAIYFNDDDNNNDIIVTTIMAW
jgi:hypothetical protein